ncbi:MAG: pyridoxal 5'-phosphate synthase glutaminase subunit PdxT [Candidatus Micrarchaeia archaeon]|jgi:5'-phosphate synthase pdxT subunit
MATIGVIAVQGAVSEHVSTFQRALSNLGKKGQVVWVKTPAQLAQCDCIAIPGGESTSISRLMRKAALFDEVKKRAKKGMPVLATCAGFVLVAKRGDGQVAQTKQKLLELVDFQVERNAFGRQKDSFEAPVRLSFSPKPFNGVFIRAPAASKIWGAAKPVAFVNWNGEEKTVGVREGKILALAFHPELSGSTLVHEHFLGEFVF